MPLRMHISAFAPAERVRGANAGIPTPSTVFHGREKWWPGSESNQRHADFQSAALPTELPGHCWNIPRRGALDRGARIRPAGPGGPSSNRGLKALICGALPPIRADHEYRSQTRHHPAGGHPDAARPARLRRRRASSSRASSASPSCPISTRSCCSTNSARTRPRITSPVFRSTRIGASKRSRTCSTAACATRTTTATRACSSRARCSG